ncbi:MAG: M48 family metallopeptidase [Anditalea sp.]
MDVEGLKYLIIGVITLGFVFEKILSWLNVRREVKEVPPTLADHLSQQKLLEAKTYQLANYRFGMITGTFTFILTLAFIWFGLFGEIDGWLREYISHPLWLSIIYFGFIFLGSELISLPFDNYHTFKIEEDFGFNKTTRSTFFMDKIKGWGLTILIGGGLLYVLLWLVHSMGQSFWWQFWLVAAVFMVLINLFYTTLVLPLFNKLTPLEGGELKQHIMDYSKTVDFSLDNIYVIDGSKRSSKANAFFSGIGKKKKVVLYDTLINQHSSDELVAILAHEIGHYKKKHILIGMITGVLQVGLLLYILSLFIYNENISLALGGSQMAVHLNLIGFSLLFSPISTLIGLGMNLLSRKNEFQADRFAKETFAGKPLAEALKTLSIKNLSNINPHPWYVFVHYSHPPLLERLEKLE